MARRRLADMLGTPSAHVRLRGALGVILLLVAPLAAGAWVLDRATGSSDRARVDQALLETLDTARQALGGRLTNAASRAAALAAETQVQSALLHRDTARLTRIAATRHVSFVIDGRRVAGSAPSPLAQRTAVVSGSKQLGQVVVSVPVDAASLAELEQQALVRPATHIVLTRDGSVIASDALPRDTRLRASTRRATTVEVDGSDYLALAVGAGAGSAEIVALAPESRLTSASSRRLFWLVVAVLATLATAALAAALLAPAFPRNLGREARRERRKARDSVTVIGEVLASTHDRDRLLQVLLATTMEVTGAVGGRVLERNRAIAAAGDTRKGRELELALDDGETRLVLYAPPRGFEQGGPDLARSIVAQGRIALDNARLHRLAEEQAVTDDLTSLANRRQFLARLELELQRSERIDEPLAIVFADLDHFKDVNDRYGHDAGDEVLRLFAGILRDHSRTIDLPARLGGEEFAVLLPGTDAEGARSFAERVRATTAALRPPIPGGSLQVTASFGIASSAIGLSRHELLTAADGALYHAKASGRNTVTIA